MVDSPSSDEPPIGAWNLETDEPVPPDWDHYRNLFHRDCGRDCSTWEKYGDRVPETHVLYFPSPSQSKSRGPPVTVPPEMLEQTRRPGDNWCRCSLQRGLTGSFPRSNGGHLLIGHEGPMRRLQETCLTLYQGLREEATRTHRSREWKNRDMHWPILVPLACSAREQEKVIRAVASTIPCHRHEGKKLDHREECVPRLGWILETLMQSFNSAQFKGYWGLVVLERCYNNRNHNDFSCPAGKWEAIFQRGLWVPESPEETARRELLEEAGVRVTPEQVKYWSLDFMRTFRVTQTPDRCRHQALLIPDNLQMRMMHSRDLRLGCVEVREPTPMQEAEVRLGEERRQMEALRRLDPAVLAVGSSPGVPPSVPPSLGMDPAVLAVGSSPGVPPSVPPSLGMDPAVLAVSSSPGVPPSVPSSLGMDPAVLAVSSVPPPTPGAPLSVPTPLGMVDPAIVAVSSAPPPPPPPPPPPFPVPGIMGAAPSASPPTAPGPRMPWGASTFLLPPEMVPVYPAPMRYPEEMVMTGLPAPYHFRMPELMISPMMPPPESPSSPPRPTVPAPPPPISVSMVVEEHQSVSVQFQSELPPPPPTLARSRSRTMSVASPRSESPVSSPRERSQSAVDLGKDDEDSEDPDDMLMTWGRMRRQ